jgi:hypothetical protein
MWDHPMSRTLLEATRLDMWQGFGYHQWSRPPRESHPLIALIPRAAAAEDGAFW